MKVVVVGASSGLGRRIGVGLAQRGAVVALLARRQDRLVEAAREAGDGAIPVECDVVDEASCRTAIDRAASELDGIDALVYAPGIGPLARVKDIDAATWRRTLDTNVVGASLVTAAAEPYLTSARGVALYLSSVSASEGAPWPGLAAYVVSKAALDKLIEAWRVEHPSIGFTRVVVGDCEPPDGQRSEFNAGWDRDLFARLRPVWAERGHLGGTLLDVDELVEVVHLVLARGATATVPSIAVTARRG